MTIPAAVHHESRGSQSDVFVMDRSSARPPTTLTWTWPAGARSPRRRAR